MKKLLTCMTVFAVTVLMTLPVQAGIIITEGKVAKSTTTKRIKRRVTPVVLVLGAIQVNAEDVSGETESGTELEDTDDQPIADLDDDDPEGWECQDVGGGVEYCEQTDDSDDAEGAGTGAAGGGGVGEDTDVVFAGETELAGCQGSSDGPLGLLGALAALLVMMATRRRTARV